MTTTTVLFGGENRERLVAVASAQAIAAALPEADPWFWDPQGLVRPVSRTALLAHRRPFEMDFPAQGAPIGPIAATLDRAAGEGRALVLALHGGAAENGELAALCEARGVAFTGSGSKASRLAFDKHAAKAAVAAVGLTVPESVALADAPAWITAGRRLVAKPVEEGSSYGLIFVDGPGDLDRLREAAAREAYLIEPRVEGVEATCGVLEQADGRLIALPPIEIRPAGGAFDYAGKYLAKTTQEICPAGFGPSVNAALAEAALAAHRAVGAEGYSRSDFFVTDEGLVFLELNTLPGLTAASLYPKALAVEGLDFAAFLEGQVALALKRARP